jgi:hypothetical protein
MKVRTSVMAGAILTNHSQTAIVVKTGVKGGSIGWGSNHSQTIR